MLAGFLAQLKAYSFRECVHCPQKQKNNREGRLTPSSTSRKGKPRALALTFQRDNIKGKGSGESFTDTDQEQAQNVKS